MGRLTSWYVVYLSFELEIYHTFIGITPRSIRPFHHSIRYLKDWSPFWPTREHRLNPHFFFFLKAAPSQKERKADRKTCSTYQVDTSWEVHSPPGQHFIISDLSRAHGHSRVPEAFKFEHIISYEYLLFAGERILSIKTSRNNGTPNHCDRLWVIAHSSFSHEAYWWSSSFDQYWHFLFHEALLAGYKICSWDLRSSLPDFTLEHIYLCLGYPSPTLINRPSSPHQHWPTSFIHPCSHAQATTLHGASVFMFSSSLSYDIETRDLWPWNHIRALRIGISSLLLHHLIWYHVATITSRSDTRGISSPTVQVVERLDGCDPYFRRSITPTLRFKCQDIIRFPILPTKHNPQALEQAERYTSIFLDGSILHVSTSSVAAS